ncbi:MAG TPA: hypothetical protein DEH78_05480 [Solibacterales bacterium]|nr:hypothetical protein [Bryobacterales bacterium]
MRLNSAVRSRSVALSLLTFVATSAVWAQGPNAKWAQITYRKSIDGKAADHRKFLETAWVKSVEHGVAKGDLHGGLVLRLTAPFAIGSDYDYAAVIFPVKAPSLAQPSQETLDARGKAAGFANYAAYMAASRSSSTLVRQAWNVIRNRIGTVTVGSYIRTATYQVGDDHMDAVMGYMREYALPMNAARIKQGNSPAIGWSLQTPGLVGSEEAGYALTASTVLKDPEQAVMGPGPLSEESFKAMMPGKSYAEYIRQTAAINGLRKRVRTRFSEVIAVVGSVPTVN